MPWAIESEQIDVRIIKSAVFKNGKCLDFAVFIFLFFVVFFVLNFVAGIGEISKK